MPSPTPPPLLSTRTALIMTVALIFGGAAGLLVAAAGQHLAMAVLIGLGAAGSTVLALNKLIAW